MSWDKIDRSVKQATEIQPQETKPVVTKEEMQEAIQAGGRLIDRDEYRTLYKLHQDAKAGKVELKPQARQMLDAALKDGYATRIDELRARAERFGEESKFNAHFRRAVQAAGLYPVGLAVAYGGAMLCFPAVAGTLGIGAIGAITGSLIGLVGSAASDDREALAGFFAEID